MKKFVYLFLTIILLLLIIVDCSYPQDSSSDSKTKNEMTAVIKALILKVEKGIEKNEATNRVLIRKFEELNSDVYSRLLPEIMKKTLEVSKANKDVAKDYYETLNVAFFIVKYVFPIGGIIGFFLFVFNFKYIKNILCQVIYKGFRIDERDTKHWAYIFNTQSLFYYNEALRLEERKDPGRESMLDLAIDCSEGAYKRIKNMLEEPHDRDEDKFFTKICSNLCYYYGMAEKEDKFIEGLDLANLSLKKGQKYNHLNWIDNYLYFITQFISHPELEKKEVDYAKKILSKYKTPLMANKICLKDEIKSFEKKLSDFKENNRVF